MKLFGPRTSATALSLALFLASACSGGGGDSGSGTMFIETCSLGCGSGAGGVQINCAFQEISVNSEISVIFSQPVDPATVNGETFKILSTIGGQVPPGTRFVDPTNPRKVIFRPAITFDEQGSASFGFTPQTTYTLTILGTAQGSNGPFIRSVGGKSNQSKMECALVTSPDILDAVPGQPSVQILVDQAIVATPDPDDVLPGLPADGLVDVHLGSTIEFVFNDIMNPGTLANPTTQQSTFISVRVDADGDLATPEDQDLLFGSYVVTIDLNLLQTKMVFTPSNGLPNGGDPSLHPIPRKVVVNLPSQGVQDLAGNTLQNPGQVSFTPEIIDLDPVVLPDEDGENFLVTGNQDAVNSGADWGLGRLTRGFGGGSGRLGALRVRLGQTLTLNTDSQVFPLPQQQTGLPPVHDILTNYVGTATDLDPPATVTVTDGQFEFSSIIVEAGATLKLEGGNPARLFSRGPVVVFGSGRIDLRGATPAQHASDAALGGLGGAGGPNAGAGGQGGDRPDSSLTGLSGQFGGISQGGQPVSIDGRQGLGVGRVANVGGGPGGPHFPAAYPTGPAALGGLVTTLVNEICQSRQAGATGGGGGFSTDGLPSAPASSHPLAWNDTSNVPAPTPGGASSDVGLEPPDPEINHKKRKLPFYDGELWGGSGGGGGGGSLFGTLSNGTTLDFPACSSENGIESPVVEATPFRDNSSAGGGGGGGAVQLVSGKSMTVAGQILATGGAGGSALLIDPGTTPSQRTMRASPGGGGSGGGVKLQSQALLMDVTPGNPHIVIDGGLGGTNINGSQGGKGGTGLVRLEDLTGTLTRVSESPKIDPYDPTHVNPTTGLIESEQWVSAGTWLATTKRPETYSGSVSCWMQPSGSFYQLEFAEDDPGAVDPEERFGWNMEVLYDIAGVVTPLQYRGEDPDSPFLQDFETLIGNEFNWDAPEGSGSYFAVRFQGASATGTAASLCEVDVSGATQDILPGSLTPWVKHPDELNNFQPRPNMVRFTIVFDHSLALDPDSVPAKIKGVTNLKIRTQPD